MFTADRLLGLFLPVGQFETGRPFCRYSGGSFIIAVRNVGIGYCENESVQLMNPELDWLLNTV